MLVLQIRLYPQFKLMPLTYPSGILDGFLWLVSIKLTTSLYLVNHRSSCVIVSRHYSQWFSVGLYYSVCCDIVATFHVVPVLSGFAVEKSFSLLPPPSSSAVVSTAL